MDRLATLDLLAKNLDDGGELLLAFGDLSVDHLLELSKLVGHGGVEYQHGRGTVG